MNEAKRREIFQRLRALNPNPRTELIYKTPFELLIAVILSAQATDKSVNQATAALFPVANTPQSIVRLGTEGLSRYIRSIGLYKTKARNIIASCKQLIDEHDGKVPDQRAALEALPGVGRKTANVVLNTAFGQPTIAVDTHIFRVANRTGIARGKTVREVEDRLLRRVPEEFLHDAHHWLILHGRYTCKARKPECPRCPIADLCEFKHKTAEETTGQHARKARRRQGATR
jgi:endonuclease III